MTASGKGEDHKALGNQAFKDGQYLKAAAQYTAAIKAFSGEPDDLAVLHSNRCAALLKVSKLGKALQDAEKCLELRPQWDKSYFRKGSVLEAMSNYAAAAEVYQEGYKMAPESRELNNKAARCESLLKQTRARQKAESKTAANGSAQ